jgi:tripartite-type tricarboxylate transporter receptor subunit TctC
MPRRFSRAVFCALCVLTVSNLALSSLAAAQGYPAKPIRLIVTFPPGGSADIFGRSFAQRASLGQPVVVENVAGATGAIGLGRAARAPADGYTLTMGATSTFVVSPHFNEKLGYDPVADFDPIAILAQILSALVVNQSLKVGSISELVTLARANPGKLNFASLGNGSTHHLLGEMLKKAAGIQMVHVPYKGNPQALAALLAGEVQMFFFPFLDAKAHLDSGRLRALGVTYTARSSGAPSVPTLQELGYDIVAPTWHMLVAPVGTPTPILKRLASEVHRVNGLAEMKELLARQGAEPNAMGPDELKKYLLAEFERYRQIVREIGLTQ